MQMKPSRRSRAAVQESLYERIGGAAALDAALPEFYRRVLADPELSYFFDDVHIPNLIAAQKKFF